MAALVDAKTSGHHVHMLYIGLPTANESVRRVADRVRGGGHHVNEQTLTTSSALKPRRLSIKLETVSCYNQGIIPSRP